MRNRLTKSEEAPHAMGVMVHSSPVGRHGQLSFPINTGAAAELLGTTEPTLAETVRRGHVEPPPPILAGRRLWAREHLLKAAAHLDLLTEQLQARLGGASHG